MKACKVCNRLIDEGKECAVCGSRELTRNWKGMVVVWDVESEIAKKLNIKAPGKYAIQVF